MVTEKDGTTQASGGAVIVGWGGGENSDFPLDFHLFGLCVAVRWQVVLGLGVRVRTQTKHRHWIFISRDLCHLSSSWWGNALKLTEIWQSMHS